MAGRLNQSGCSNARLVYVECGTEDDELDRLEALGRQIHGAFDLLPGDESTTPKVPAPDLAEEMEALSLADEFYRVIGDSDSAGVVVSRTEDPVDFADRLRNRVVNLVPVAEIAKVTSWVSEATQTVGIYPSALHDRLRDALALSGVQHIRALSTSLEGYVYSSGRLLDPAAARRHGADAPDGPLDHRPELTSRFTDFSAIVQLKRLRGSWP